MEHSLEPAEVPRISTKYRTIKTRFPVSESLETLRASRESEFQSMCGQPPWSGGGLKVFKSRMVVATAGSTGALGCWWPTPATAEKRSKRRFAKYWTALC